MGPSDSHNGAIRPRRTVDAGMTDWSVNHALSPTPSYRRRNTAGGWNNGLFGLHSSALVAKELQGTLVAESDGPGCGATFTFELPRIRAEVPA